MTMRKRVRSNFTPTLMLTLTAIGGVATTPAAANSCMGPAPEESRAISVTTSPGKQTNVSVNVYPKGSFDAEYPRCVAYYEIELSAFPTSRLASRPHDIAPALRETAEELGVDECQITVHFLDDKGDELEPHETCITGTFKYDKGDFWSSSSEDFCWHPEEL